MIGDVLDIRKIYYVILLYCKEVELSDSAKKRLGTVAMTDDSSHYFILNRPRCLVTPRVRPLELVLGE